MTTATATATTTTATATPKAPVFGLDVLRVAAAFAVVWLHVSSYVVLNQEPLTAAWWVGNAAEVPSRWCVPVFILISGALLLGPRNETAGEFYRKRMNRILIPLVFWTVLYLGLKLATHATTPAEAAALLLQGRPHYHLWYLYMALGLYLFTPALRIFVRAASERERASVTFLIMSVSVAAIAPAYLAGWKGTFVTLFVPYVGYYLLGYHLVQVRPRVSTGALWAVLLSMSVLVTAGTGPLVSVLGLDAGQYLYAYVGVPVIAMSLAVYLLGLKLPALAEDVPPWVRSGVGLLAGASMGIYLIHPLFLAILQQLYGYDVFCRLPLLSIPALTIFSFVASGATALVLLRIPHVRRII